MAYDVSCGLYIGTLVAAADLSASQFKLVYINSSAQIAVPATAGIACVGVLKNTPTSGGSCEVQFGGITKVQYGGTIAAGALVMTNNAGQAVTYTGAESATPVGIAVLAGVSGDIGSIYLFNNGAQNTANVASAYVALSGKYSNAGGSATATITATGILTTDEVFAAIQSSVTAVSIQKVTPTANTITVLMSADPGTSVISWFALRADT